MKAFVTGGAGFIGSNLVDRLLADGHDVTAYDNLSTGQEQFLREAQGHSRFRLVRGDVLDAERLRAAVEGHDTVFHLAANADVRFGTDHPRRDLEQARFASKSSDTRRTPARRRRRRPRRSRRPRRRRTAG